MKPNFYLFAALQLCYVSCDLNLPVTQLNPIDPVIIDEEEIVFTRTPTQLHAIDDQHVLLIHDKEELVLLDRKTGKMAVVFNDVVVDKALLIDAYVQKQYPEKEYQRYEDFKDVGLMPLSKLTNMAIADDNLYIYYDLLTPFLSSYEGKHARKWEYTPFLLTFNLDFKLTDIHLIKKRLRANGQYVNPNTGILVNKHQLFTNSHLLLQLADSANTYYGIVQFAKQDSVYEIIQQLLSVKINEPNNAQPVLVIACFYQVLDGVVYASYKNNIHNLNTNEVAVTLPKELQINNFWIDSLHFIVEVDDLTTMKRSIWLLEKGSQKILDKEEMGLTDGSISHVDFQPRSCNYIQLVGEDHLLKGFNYGHPN